jgi:hypothetical protein
MTNLFPLPCWAPALKRVPLPLQALNRAFVHGAESAPDTIETERALDPAMCFSPFAPPLSATGEDVSRFAPG